MDMCTAMRTDCALLCYTTNFFAVCYDRCPCGIRWYNQCPSSIVGITVVTGCIIDSVAVFVGIFDADVVFVGTIDIVQYSTCLS